MMMMMNKSDIANYAYDTTPHSVETTMYSILNSFETDTHTWFRDNYLQLNADKCHILISNLNKDINVREEVIECSTLSNY